MSSDTRRSDARAREPLRRALDLALALPAAALSSPLMGLIGLAIRLDSPGPVIYRQIRIGRDGRPFTIYKFRTLVDGAEQIGSGLVLEEGDQRITRVGRVLRRYSLDELPNLWNVLRGEMSIVGPRATLPYQVAQYTDRQRARLTVKPGITGWAQVNGRAALPWEQRIELDLWYLEHRSLRLDLRIIGRTFRLVARGHGLHRGRYAPWHPPAPEGERPSADPPPGPGGDPLASRDG
jgi:lipopolysaccharide/colanic/teichoic acid biosynthesis glycosyltransferase